MLALGASLARGPHQGGRGGGNGQLSFLDTGSGPFLLLKRPNFSSGGRIAAVVDERGVFQVSETLKPVQKQELASVDKAALKVLPENGEAG